MFKTVNVGGKELKFRASAQTSFLYKKIFNKDILAVLSNVKESMDIDSILGLAYVMNLQAENPKTLDDIMHGKVSEVSFLQWLDDFEYTDLIDAEFISSVTDAWLRNTETSTKSKNQYRPQ